MHNSCLGISPKYLIFRNAPKPIIDPCGISFLYANFETFTIFRATVLKTCIYPQYYINKPLVTNIEAVDRVNLLHSTSCRFKVIGIRPLVPVQNSVSLKLTQRKTLNFVTNLPDVENITK